MIVIQKVADADALANEAARLTAMTLQAFLQTEKLATFVLAGGRLPPAAAAILAEDYADSVDWSRVLFLIGDERCVPLDNPDSSWLSLLPLFAKLPAVPTEHQLRPASQLTAEAAAEAYQTVLQGLSRDQAPLPQLDQLWLGIGEDGHTLSIFPNHPSSNQTGAQLVMPVHDSPKPPSDRISLTYKALAGVKSALVFISGASKAPILAEIAGGNHSLPIVVASQAISRAGGQVTWLVDAAAAANLPPDQEIKL